MVIIAKSIKVKTEYRNDDVIVFCYNMHSDGSKQEILSPGFEQCVVRAE